MAENKRIVEKKYVTGAGQLILSFLGAYGICYICGKAGFQNAYFTVLGAMVMAGVWGMLSWAKRDLAVILPQEARKRRIMFAVMVSYLFSLAMVMGYQLQSSGMTDSGFKGKFMILMRAACLTVAVFPFGNFVFKNVEKIHSVKVRELQRAIRPRTVFLICAIVTFLCLIPVWLAYYPIIMSYDFHRQINEAAKGFAWFYPYQPIAHTWVIWLFLQVGELLGSSEMGFACMSLFQMLLYSLVAAYAVTVVYRIAKRLLPIVLALLYFAVFPFNTVLVVCTTKDVLFTILFLLFFILLLERTFFCAGKKKLVVDVLLVLEGSLMAQFRNNAFYAVAVFMVLFFLLVPRKEKIEALFLGILLIAGSKVTQLVILEAIGTQIGAPKIEMYSVPIQQMARVGCRQGDNLDPETAALLDSYLKREIWESYNPPIADTVKGSGKVNTDKFTEDMGRFIQDWTKIGLKYPNEYIDAFLELTRGYWFPDDVSWAENLGYGTGGRMGAIFTYNSSEIEGVGSIEHETKFAWLEEQLEKIVSGNAFYNWPVVSQLFKSAFYVWGLFLVMVSYWYLKQKKQFIIGLFPTLYFATMLLGPVVQLRYLFPNMSVLPVMLALMYLPFCDKQESGN